MLNKQYICNIQEVVAELISEPLLEVAITTKAIS